MGDSLTEKIDGFFNVVDATVDEVGKIISRGTKTGTAARKVARDARNANPDSTPDAGSWSSSTASRTKVAASRVRIIESIDAQTGKPVWVVTDGVSRSECTSRALADRVARAMEIE